MTLLLTLAAVLGVAEGGFDTTHQSLDALLKRHVAEDLVDYGALKGERGGLDAYLDAAGKVNEEEFKQWDESTQLAFLINLYNAATLQLIIDHYPVDGIKSIGSLLRSPWSLEVVTLHGKKISLDTLEHGIIRKQYPEPRIHFAVVCAALGCPPLRAEAYVGDRLDAQLDEQTRIFLSDAEKNRVDSAAKVLHLSPIFKWYRQDFEVGGKTLQDYVAPWYSEQVDRAQLANYTVKFTDYDWALNDQPR